MLLLLFTATLSLLDTSITNVIAIKHQDLYKFTKNPIAGKLTCVPIFSVVQESDRPLILSRGNEYFTMSFSNPYDAISLLTELIQSQSNGNKSNLWKIKTYSLETWISKMKDDKKFGLKHKLIHSSLENKLDKRNEFEVYFCKDLKMDGKTLIFFDIKDLEGEIQRFSRENKKKLNSKIQSTCLINLITNNPNKLDNYSFVPSKRALEYLTFRRI